MTLKNKLKNNYVIRVLSLLNRAQIRNLGLITISQTLLGFLDLLGIIALGALGALSVQGIESREPGDRVSEILDLIGIQDLSFQLQVGILGFLASFVLLLKTLGSVFFTRKTFFYLSRISSINSSNLISSLLSLNFSRISRISSQETLFIVSEGTRYLILGVLATSMTLIADLSLVLILCVALLFTDVYIAIASIILFTIVGFSLHRLLHLRAEKLGNELKSKTVESNRKILEALGSYREILIRNRRKFYSDQILEQRIGLGDIAAEPSFLPYTSKYVIETSFVLASLILSGYAFGTKTATEAFALLAVFLGASSRLAPAVLRIQQGMLTVQNGIGASRATLELMEDLAPQVLPTMGNQPLDFDHPGFISSIELNDACFEYKGESSFKVSKLNLTIDPGESVAFVGPTGAGKSTIADLILGILDLSSGSVAISGVSPRRAYINWPGAVAYVPQNVNIESGTIRENICLGFPIDIATDAEIRECLSMAQLSDFVDSLPKNIDSDVGESGDQLSGGQRQLLGIARALLTKPKILILDEATSALDGITEASINQAINSLSGKVTTVVIAHRLSTVLQVDRVVYVEKGRILASGTFSEVRSVVPNFDKQARLAGID